MELDLVGLGCDWVSPGGVMYSQVNKGVRIKMSNAELMSIKSKFHQHPVVRVGPTRGLQNLVCMVYNIIELR